MWQLLFEDQFLSDSSLSATGAWTTGDPMAPMEPQYYTRYDKNFTTKCPNKGGINHAFSGSDLTLVVKWEPGNYEWWNWDSAGIFFPTCPHFNYTSGRILSKANYLYGKFEIRCKIPASGRMYWPAFWLYGEDPDHYREIDVFEFADQSKTSLITTLHLSRTDDNNFEDPPEEWGNPPKNKYSHTTDLTVNVGQYHIYSVIWTPNSVTWFFDGNPVYSLGGGHVPHRDVAIIADLAIAPWMSLPTQSQLPAGMQIDYIRVYRNDGKEFLFQAGNPGDNRLGGWIIHLGDQYISADVDGDGTSEVLIIGLNGWSTLARWSGGTWPGLWNNGGNHKIMGWVLNPRDQFVAGDFDGDGRSEILMIALNGWCTLARWSGGTWPGLWNNGGNRRIMGWVLNPGDQFVAGDLDGDGKSEILMIALNGWSTLARWSSGTWPGLWNNGGTGKIKGWVLHAGDRFIPADFDGDGKTEILVISVSGWAALLQWTGLDWSIIWDNQGAGTIHLWFMNSSDRFFPLKNSGGPQTLAAISTGGWWQTLRFDPLP